MPITKRKKLFYVEANKPFINEEGEEDFQTLRYIAESESEADDWLEENEIKEEDLISCDWIDATILKGDI